MASPFKGIHAPAVEIFPEKGREGRGKGREGKKRGWKKRGGEGKEGKER